MHKNIVPEQNEDLVFETGVLFRLKSEGHDLQVFIHDEQHKLIDI